MRNTTCFIFFILVLACLNLPARALAQEEFFEKSYALSVYGGSMTNRNWRQSISGQANTVGSHILAMALSCSFYQPSHRLWSLELEANLARHFGMQNHFEFNAPLLTARWLALPWNKVVQTSLAYGIGPSYATKVPRYERAHESSSKQFLLFWHLEADFRRPGSDWALLARLHHRSSGFGLMAPRGGGNVLTLGMRRSF